MHYLHFVKSRLGVVIPLSVVDLLESYKDALADITSTFRAGFQPFIALGSFREGFPTNNT
jgi:hypothetical protein